VKLSFLYIKKIANWLLNILFVESCLGCQSKDEILCQNCLIKIRRAERETERGIMACFDYRDPLIKKAIWNLKYYRRSHLGPTLGRLLYESFIEEISDMKIFASGQPILVIPVPLSKMRAKTRGYNQAERIARGFCDCGGVEILELKNNILIKKIDTLPQARITNRARRLKNIKSVFEIKNSESVKGRTIIVIDDVTTTGGTITEIMNILKKSGAKKVVGFAVAH
jgi:competence protein ComFC